MAAAAAERPAFLIPFRATPPPSHLRALAVAKAATQSAPPLAHQLASSFLARESAEQERAALEEQRRKERLAREAKQRDAEEMDRQFDEVTAFERRVSPLLDWCDDDDPSPPTLALPSSTKKKQTPGGGAADAVAIDACRTSIVDALSDFRVHLYDIRASRAFPGRASECKLYRDMKGEDDRANVDNGDPKKPGQIQSRAAELCAALVEKRKTRAFLASLVAARPLFERLRAALSAAGSTASGNAITASQKDALDTLELLCTRDRREHEALFSANLHAQRHALHATGIDAACSRYMRLQREALFFPPPPLLSRDRWDSAIAPRLFSTDAAPSSAAAAAPSISLPSKAAASLICDVWTTDGQAVQIHPLRSACELANYSIQRDWDSQPAELSSFVLASTTRLGERRSAFLLPFLAAHSKNRCVDDARMSFPRISPTAGIREAQLYQSEAGRPFSPREFDRDILLRIAIASPRALLFRAIFREMNETGHTASGPRPFSVLTPDGAYHQDQRLQRIPYVRTVYLMPFLVEHSDMASATGQARGREMPPSLYFVELDVASVDILHSAFDALCAGTPRLLSGSLATCLRALLEQRRYYFDEAPLLRGLRESVQDWALALIRALQRDASAASQRVLKEDAKEWTPFGRFVRMCFSCAPDEGDDQSQRFVDFAQTESELRDREEAPDVLADLLRATDVTLKTLHAGDKRKTPSANGTTESPPVSPSSARFSDDDDDGDVPSTPPSASLPLKYPRLEAGDRPLDAETRSVAVSSSRAEAHAPAQAPISNVHLFTLDVDGEEVCT